MIGSAYVVFYLALVVGLCCFVLVFHCHYEDGLFGRLGLALMFVASFSRMAGIAEVDFDIEISKSGMVLWAGLALFLARHLYRFLSFRRNGKHAWREAESGALGGKVPR